MQTNTQNSLRLNYQIKASQVRVVLEDGTSPGVMLLKEALKLAQDQGLDLIEINPKAAPPVCRIQDWGKFCYAAKKQQQAMKKNQKTSEMKELTLHPNTELNDLNHKLEQAKDFLTEGNKVKLTVKFRGREMAHPELGREKLDWMLQQLTDLTGTATPVSFEGKKMDTVLTPKSNKG
jgi:translation initiation factor IF-3